MFVFADDVDLNSRFYRQLVAPMTSVLDGNSFRDGLTRVTEKANLNLWLDRNVDPSRPIDAGPLGSTVFAALEKLAASQQCVILPLEDVVLIGRQSWVDRTASVILAIPAKKRGARLDISWEALSTPDEAIAAAAGESNLALTGLPHDLWPAVHWQGIDREVAVQLVLSQFHSLETVHHRIAPAADRFTRRYSASEISISKLRESMQTVDPDCDVRIAANWIVANGTIAAHRKALSTMLAPPDVATPLNPEQATFTLKRMTTSAENAFTQLARAAGRTCEITADAGDACKAMVSVEGQDSTLSEIVNAIASQVGVSAKWDRDKLRIDLRHESSKRIDTNKDSE